MLSPEAAAVEHRRQEVLKGVKHMRMIMVRIALAMLFVLACGSTLSIADGGIPPPPLCPPSLSGVCP
jgi:hypothetical protein